MFGVCGLPSSVPILCFIYKRKGPEICGSFSKFDKMREEDLALARALAAEGKAVRFQVTSQPPKHSRVQDLMEKRSQFR